MTPTYKDAATGKAVPGEVYDWDGYLDTTLYTAKLRNAVGGVGHIFRGNCDNALCSLGPPPPHAKATQAEAVAAVKAALKSCSFLSTGQLKLSA